MNNKTIIIAEAGVNHNGSLERALEMVDVAAETGADFVKFQSFRADRLVTRNARKADYQIQQTQTSESQYEMLKQLELNHEMHLSLIERCKATGIAFMSTPFDQSGIQYLVESLQVEKLKISSGDLLNPLMLLDAAKTEKDIVLSTGMASLSDVKTALSILCFGYSRMDMPPTNAGLKKAWEDETLRSILRDRVCVLHCNTEYPTPFVDVNLRAMATIREELGIQVGYSDHSVGITVAIGAAALGARILEKHFTLDKGMSGPDHAASIEPKELEEMVKRVREMETALGVPDKVVSKSEEKNVDIARKSLVAACGIQKGEAFSANNLAIKRPGSGISPLKYWELIGERAVRDYNPDDLIEPIQ